MSFIKLGLVTNLMAISFVALNGTSKELMANHSVDLVELCLIQNATCLVFTLISSAFLGITLWGDVPKQTRPMLLASAIASAIHGRERPTRRPISCKIGPRCCSCRRSASSRLQPGFKGGGQPLDVSAIPLTSCHFINVTSLTSLTWSLLEVLADLIIHKC